MKIPFKKKSIAEYILYSAIIIGGILIDQLTKFLVSEFMHIGQSIPIIKNFLHLTYTTNDGAAFGMMDDQRWIFIVISTVTILGLTVYLYLGHAANKLYGISIAMIVSGGIGNMIDRVVLGFVVDFIDFCLFDFWVWVFNIADAAVCVGAALFVLDMILEIVRDAKKPRHVSENAEGKENADG